LRTNEDVTCEVQTTFLLTANNASITIDLARRALHCRLVPHDERPELRGGYRIEFPIRHIEANRSRLLGAALTILRAYVAAGRPDVSMRRMGTFEEWSAVVRAALVWAGCADPAETQDALRETAATELDEQRALLEAWHAHVGSRPTALNALLTDLAGCIASNAEHETAAPLVSAIGAVCATDAKLTPRALGAQLKKRRDRVVGGLRLESAGSSKLGEQWRVAPSR
jgi:hypothetical protein